MLDQLFGNRSIEKILLFTLVNGTCYASQLHRLMQLPLTPVQKGLEKLEKMGVLVATKDCNKKTYAFNTSFPLMEELEILLKKAYVLLTPNEKSLYYYIRQVPNAIGQNQHLLFETWKIMRKVKKVGFQFYTKGKLQGEGVGSVENQYDGNAVLIFRECGTWQGLQGQEFTFRNVFRWTLNRVQSLLTLEHLRHGEQNPVFLFHLTQASQDHFQSVHPHVCSQDTYFGQLIVQNPVVKLVWRIIGPKKNEEIHYNYSP